MGASGTVWGASERVQARLGVSGSIWQRVKASGSALGASENAGTTSECLVACEDSGTSGSVRERLATFGSVSQGLGASGSVWQRLGRSGSVRKRPEDGYGTV